MRLSRSARTTAALAVAGLGIAIVPLTANASAGSSAAAPSVQKAATSAEVAAAPITKFVSLKPWTSTGALRVKATVKTAPAGTKCIPSGVTGRKDAYRCFAGNTVMDPVFKSPTKKSGAFRNPNGSWLVLTKIASFESHARGAATILAVKLVNGAHCEVSTGAGPTPLPGFPWWAGTCSGGPYGSTLKTWRATDDDGNNINYPMLALNKARTKWAVAVEASKGKVTMVPVTVAYR